MKKHNPKILVAFGLAAALSTPSMAAHAAEDGSTPLLGIIGQTVSPVPDNTIRLQKSAEFSDYSDSIKQALSTLMEQGGGTLIIPQGNRPIEKGVLLEIGDKVANIAIRGEKSADGKLPVVHASNPKRALIFFFFIGDIKSPGLSVWMSDFEIKGNNVPVDWSKSGEPFQLDEGQTDMEPNKNLPADKTYGGHPFFFHSVDAAGILVRNIKTVHIDNMTLRDVFGNGIVLANYG